MRESEYQAKITRKLYDLFPGCEILKTDATYRQGFPDLLILWGEYWGVLEVKTSLSASIQPNQDHYVQRLNGMSFAAYICPENEEEVLNALQQAFKSPRRARIS